MITLSNEFLTAKFAETGAELKSLVYNNDEYIWHGDKNIWGNSSPVLFPICSGLKDDTFYHNGKSYKLEKHGYASNSLFEIEDLKKDTVTFLLRETEESLKKYPFCYELRVIYSLVGKKLEVEYRVKNLSSGDMPFSIGAHEGYYFKGGTEQCEIKFSKTEDLNTCVLDGDLLSYEKKSIAENCDTLKIKNEYFKDDALIFDDLKSREVALKSRVTEKGIKLNFPDFPYFLIWSIPNAEFLCLEPWSGITDYVDTNQELKNKKGINILPANEEKSFSHSIEILNT